MITLYLQIQDMHLIFENSLKTFNRSQTGNFDSSISKNDYVLLLLENNIYLDNIIQN